MNHQKSFTDLIKNQFPPNQLLAPLNIIVNNTYQN